MLGLLRSNCRTSSQLGNHRHTIVSVEEKVHRLRARTTKPEMLQLQRRLAVSDQEGILVPVRRCRSVLGFGRRHLDFDAKDFSFTQIMKRSRAGRIGTLRNHGPSTFGFRLGVGFRPPAFETDTSYRDSSQKLPTEFISESAAYFCVRTDKECTSTLFHLVL